MPDWQKEPEADSLSSTSQSQALRALGGPQLRKAINDALPSDSEFNAFCIDYFPRIQKQFSNGQGRTDKCNMLLQLVHPTEIWDALQKLKLENNSYPLSATRGRDGANKQSIDNKPVNRLQFVEGAIIADRYRLLRMTGSSGLVVEWQAFDNKTNQSVTLRILPCESSRGSSHVEQFLRNARQLYSLCHRHIAQTLDGPTETQKSHYLVMEYPMGGDLNRAIMEKKIDRDQGLRSILQIGEALEHMHRQGVIHRDVRPQNILFDAHGQAKLAGFDLVRDTDSMEEKRPGTTEANLFAAPESVADVSLIDGRADVYSLAMSVIFVLYQRALPQSFIWERTQLIEVLDCSSVLKNILHKAAAPDPRERPKTVADFCATVRNSLVSSAFVGVPQKVPLQIWLPQTHHANTETVRVALPHGAQGVERMTVAAARPAPRRWMFAVGSTLVLAVASFCLVAGNRQEPVGPPPSGVPALPVPSSRLDATNPPVDLAATSSVGVVMGQAAHANHTVSKPKSVEHSVHRQTRKNAFSQLKSPLDCPSGKEYIPCVATIRDRNKKTNPRFADACNNLIANENEKAAKPHLR